MKKFKKNTGGYVMLGDTVKLLCDHYDGNKCVGTAGVTGLVTSRFGEPLMVKVNGTEFKSKQHNVTRVAGVKPNAS